MGVVTDGEDLILLKVLLEILHCHRSNLLLEFFGKEELIILIKGLVADVLCEIVDQFPCGCETIMH